MRSDKLPLEGYFGLPDAGFTEEQWKRYLAVQAALDIAKASVSAPTSYTGANKTYADLGYVAEKIDDLADAIQYALESSDEEE